MDKKIKKKLEDTVVTLAENAKSHDATDSMQFTQAALNMCHVMSIMEGLSYEVSE